MRLAALNVLREPAVWQRLIETRVPVGGGPYVPANTSFAKAAGVTLKFSGAFPLDEEQGWRTTAALVADRPKPVPLTEAIQELAASCMAEIVLDGATIKFVTRKDALLMWRAWSKELKGSK